jgi:hypothetical protein
VVGEDFYGVKPEGVVSSQIDYELTRDADGKVQLLRTNKLVASGPNEGPGKPPNIQRILGRRPCVAGGNSAGDAEMLEYAMAYPSLAVLVNHDDGERGTPTRVSPAPLPLTRASPIPRLGWGGRLSASKMTGQRSLLPRDATAAG